MRNCTNLFAELTVNSILKTGYGLRFSDFRPPTV